MKPIFIFFGYAFYETGGVRKNKLTDADVKLIADLLNEVKPHQVYAAGDLADPHGTHRVCLDAILWHLKRRGRRFGGKTAICGCIGGVARMAN